MSLRTDHKVKSVRISPSAPLAVGFRAFLRLRHAPAAPGVRFTRRDEVAAGVRDCIPDWREPVPPFILRVYLRRFARGKSRIVIPHEVVKCERNYRRNHLRW